MTTGDSSRIPLVVRRSASFAILDMLRKLALRLAVVLVLILLAIQLVPYGRSHRNPPVVLEPPWDSPATRTLAERACFDCHSNLTRWPWYSHVAPVSWLVQHDVDEGRAKLNFSEWNVAQREAGEASEVVREGEMPPRIYTWTHEPARLDATQGQQLAAGLARTLGGRGPARGANPHETEDDEHEAGSR